MYCNNGDGWVIVVRFYMLCSMYVPVLECVLHSFISIPRHIMRCSKQVKDQNEWGNVRTVPVRSSDKKYCRYHTGTAIKVPAYRTSTCYQTNQRPGHEWRIKSECYCRGDIMQLGYYRLKRLCEKMLWAPARVYFLSFFVHWFRVQHRRKEGGREKREKKKKKTKHGKIMVRYWYLCRIFLRWAQF